MVGEWLSRIEGSAEWVAFQKRKERDEKKENAGAGEPVNGFKKGSKYALDEQTMEEILVKLFEAHDNLNNPKHKLRSKTKRRWEAVTKEIEFRGDGKDKNIFKKIDAQLEALEDNLHRMEHQYENPELSRGQWMFNARKNKSIKNFFN